MLAIWIILIFHATEIRSVDDVIEKLECYDCDSHAKEKPDCEETCKVSASEGACAISIEQQKTEVRHKQYCLEDMKKGDNSFEACRLLNRGLLTLSKLTPATKTLCYVCQQNMCNALDEMPRDDLSVYVPFLVPEKTAKKIIGSCYVCNSTFRFDCNKIYRDCTDSLSCYALYQDGVYQQGCRFIDSVDDFECDKIQNNPEKPKDYCSICHNECLSPPFSACCNDLEEDPKSKLKDDRKIADNRSTKNNSSQKKAGRSASSTFTFPWAIFASSGLLCFFF